MLLVSSAPLSMHRGETEAERAVACAHCFFPYQWISEVSVTTSGGWGCWGSGHWATALSWTGSREHLAMLCCYSSTCKETKLSMNCTTGAMLAAFEYFTSLFSKRPSWKRGAGRQEVEFSWGCTDLPWPQECAQDAARCPADCLPAFPLQV